MMFTACSSDDTTTQNAERVPINFTANIQQLIPAVGTRVSNGTSGLTFTEFAEGAAITIGYTNTTNVINLKKASDGTWNYTGDKLYYPLNGASQTVVALYPNQTKSISDLWYQYEVPTDQSELSNYQSADLMGAAATISTPTSEPIVLNFSHLGAKIVVNLSGGTIPSNFTIKMKNIIFRAMFKVTDGVVSLQNMPYKRDYTFGNYTSAGQTAIIIPQEVAASTALFEVGTGDVTYTYTTTDAINFKAGYEYTFNLTFSQTAINLSDVSITDWSADPEKSDAISGNLAQ